MSKKMQYLDNENTTLTTFQYRSPLFKKIIETFKII